MPLSITPRPRNSPVRHASIREGVFWSVIVKGNGLCFFEEPTLRASGKFYAALRRLLGGFEERAGYLFGTTRMRCRLCVAGLFVPPGGTAVPVGRGMFCTFGGGV